MNIFRNNETTILANNLLDQTLGCNVEYHVCLLIARRFILCEPIGSSLLYSRALFIPIPVMQFSNSFNRSQKKYSCIYKMTRTSRVKNQKPPGKCSLHDVPYHFLNIPKNSARFGKIFHFKTPHLKHCLCYFLRRISLLKQYLLKFSPNLAMVLNLISVILLRSHQPA